MLIRPALLLTGAALLAGCAGLDRSPRADVELATATETNASAVASAPATPAPAPAAATPAPASPVPASPAPVPAASADATRAAPAAPPLSAPGASTAERAASAPAVSPPTPTAKPAARRTATPAASAARPITNAAPAAAPVAPAAPAVTVAPLPDVLELGIVHPWVVWSQQRLNALAFGPLDTDGRFGPATRAAVTRFEQVNGTVVDGRLQADERLLLFSNSARANIASTPAPAPAQAPVAVPVPVAAVPPQAPTRLPVAGDGLATPATARGNANCQGIAAEFVRQGAELPVAEQFAYVIAPRESGCVPQLVSTATDLSYSRIGLNFIGVMPQYWGALCGVTDYHATAELSVDVKCGLAAYRALGWKPWAL